MQSYSLQIDNLYSYLFASRIQQIKPVKAKGDDQLDTFTKISEIRDFCDTIDTRETEFPFFVKHPNIIRRSKKLRTMIPFVESEPLKQDIIAPD